MCQESRDEAYRSEYHKFLNQFQNLITLTTTTDNKTAVSRNSAKLGNYKMPVKLRET